MEGGKRFAGRVALVTGGAGAIGAATARALREAGARVAVLDRVDAPDGVADLSIAGDVTDERAVGAAVTRVTTALGSPDLLVCAAGVLSEAPLGTLTAVEWRRVVDSSLTGAFHVLGATLPAMAAAGRGAAVAISSGWATRGYPRGSHYAAAKAGIEALVKSAALEVAGRGVRVNAVAPGPVLTPFLDAMPAVAADAAAWRRERAAAIPLGRVAEPADVVGPVLFLLGEDSAYITGQVLHVNGGLLMP